MCGLCSSKSFAPGHINSTSIVASAPRAKLMDERRGDCCSVADARQGDDQEFHKRAIFSSRPVVDLPGTNGTKIIFSAR